MAGRWVRPLSLFVIMGASASVWVGALAADYEAPQSRGQKPASGWATKKAVDLDATIEEKLKRVLENQQLILQKADAVKQELEVIKVRISLRRTRGDVVP